MDRRDLIDNRRLYPPTQKQLEYARQLALKHKTTIPLIALEDKSACSKFIESVSNRPVSELGVGSHSDQITTGSAQPSDKQVQFASKLSKDLGLGPIPDEATKSRAAMAEYIKSLLDHQRSVREAAPDPTLVQPTPKQVQRLL